MQNAFRNPVFVTGIVAIVSVVLLLAALVISRSEHYADQRQTPPGTTFRSVTDAGARLTPTPPEPPLAPTSLMPKQIGK